MSCCCFEGSPTYENCKEIQVTVELLGGNNLSFTLSSKALVQEVFELACNHIGLKETKYFGLAILKHKEDYFCTLTRKLEDFIPRSCLKRIKKSKQIKHPELTFYFKVKSYVHDVSVIQDHITRKLYYQQLKQNLQHYLLKITEEKCFVLAAYSLQWDIGNYIPEKHQKKYFNPQEHFPRWAIEHCGADNIYRNMPPYHQNCYGKTQEEAMESYITEMSQPHTQHNMLMYSIVLQQKHKSTRAWLSVFPHGVSIYQLKDNFKVPVHTIQWRDVKKIQIKKRKLEIQCLTKGKQPDKVLCYTRDNDEAMQLFSLCQLSDKFPKYMVLVSPQSAIKRETDKSEHVKDYEVIKEALHYPWNIIWSDTIKVTIKRDDIRDKLGFYYKIKLTKDARIENKTFFLVEDVSDNTPAFGKLFPGDWIRSVNDKALMDNAVDKEDLKMKLEGRNEVNIILQRPNQILRYPPRYLSPRVCHGTRNTNYENDHNVAVVSEKRSQTNIELASLPVNNGTIDLGLYVNNSDCLANIYQLNQIVCHADVEPPSYTTLPYVRDIEESPGKANIALVEENDADLTESSLVVESTDRQTDMFQLQRYIELQNHTENVKPMVSGINRSYSYESLYESDADSNLPHPSFLMRAVGDERTSSKTQINIISTSTDVRNKVIMDKLKKSLSTEYVVEILNSDSDKRIQDNNNNDETNEPELPREHYSDNIRQTVEIRAFTCDILPVGGISDKSVFLVAFDLKLLLEHPTEEVDRVLTCVHQISLYNRHVPIYLITNKVIGTDLLSVVSRFQLLEQNLKGYYNQFSSIIAQCSHDNSELSQVFHQIKRNETTGSIAFLVDKAKDWHEIVSTMKEHMSV